LDCFPLSSFSNGEPRLGQLHTTKQNNFKLNNFEQCQKLTKQKGKPYTIRKALACGEVEVEWGIPDEQLHIMEQVHATIIMILLLRDLQNHKAKNRVKKNC